MLEIMNNKRIALAYCIDNVQIAEEIENRISAASPYQFDHVYCKRNTNEASIAERLEDFSGPILLIISDNFLKSAQCMKKGLAFLQKKGAQVLPVVADGFAADDDSGRVKKIQTNFERVSDIIQYINFWQDQYLDLRRQKRQIEGLDEETFSAHLKVMREISSEAGEFLRLLRNMDYVSSEELMAENFRRFFDSIDDKDGWESFRLADQEYLAKREEEAGTPKEDIADEEPELMEDEPVDNREESSPSRAPEEAGEAPRKETAVEVITQEEEDEEEAEQDEEEPEAEAEETHYDRQAILQEAAELANAGEYQQSIKLLADTVATHPTDSELRYRYALTLAQKQDHLPAAREQMDVLLEMAPGNTPAQFLKGELAELAGDYDMARTQYEAIAESNPDHPDIFYRLGIILANHFPEEADHAAAAFRRAFEINSDNEDAYYQYAMLLNETMGRSQEAAEYFKKVLDKQANHPFANYDLALLHHRQGEIEKARKFYLLAVEVNPELQTEENDIAFAVDQPAEPVEEETPTVSEEAPALPDNVEEEVETRTLEFELELSDEQEEEEEEEEEEETIPEPLRQQDAFVAGEINGSPSVEETQEEEEEDNPIDALKKNIERLEHMMKERGKSAEKPVVSREGEGKIVMITGATSGIGRATARVFAEKGYRLILTGRRRERLERLQRIFSELYDTESRILVFDVRHVDELKKVFGEELDFEWRQIDILINNAGKAKGLDPIYRGRLDHWEEMIDTNIKGLLYLTRAVTPYMVKRRTGHIINIGSTAGKEVYPAGNVYNATKFAVDAITKAMRLDLVDFNIRVSQISPGHVEHTEFAKVRFDGDEEKAKIYEDFIPLTADDVAQTIHFIASQPRHVNIQDIVLSGTQQAGPTKIARSGRQALDAFIGRIRPKVEDGD